MPYPVLPPDPPPIINYVSPEDTSTPPASTGDASISDPSTSPSVPSTRATRVVSSAVPDQVCHVERSHSTCSVPTVERAAEPMTARRAQPLGPPVELESVAQQAKFQSPVTFGLTEIHTDLNPPTHFTALPNSHPLSHPNPQPTTVATATVPPAVFDATEPGEPLATVTYRRPEMMPAARQLQSDLENLHLPVIEELAQQPSREPSTSSGSGSTPDANAPFLIIPSQGDVVQGDPLPQTPRTGSEPSTDEAPAPNSESPSSPTGAGTPQTPANGDVTTPPASEPVPTPPANGTTPPENGTAPASPANGTTPPATGESAASNNPSGTGEAVELDADEQQYDNLRQVFFAEGNVEMRFRGAVLNSDRLHVNLPNRIAVAEGNVVLTRGSQVIRGDRFVYNFVQQNGEVLNASGEIFLPGTNQDFAPALPTDVTAGAVTNATVVSSQPPRPGAPAQGVVSPGGINISVGTTTEGGLSGGTTTGAVRRIRFEAERIDFTADGWQAQNVRLTNDPFSPPELEIRSRYVTFARLTPTRSEIRARNPRIVFDQGLSLPLLQNRVIIDNRRRNPGLFQIGFDQEDRGGLYIQRSFDVYTSPAIQFTVTPQILVQRAFDNGGDFGDLRNYGLNTRLDATLGPRTSLRGTAVFTSLNPDDFSDKVRASIRARQQIGTPWGNHALSLEYSYRDRLFNGSLGFQTVQSSLGILLTSPSILLGNTGIYLSYQAGVQRINARTDREDLLPPLPRDNNRVTLTRAQVSAAVNRGFVLWQGTALPPTASEGLRYSPNPLTPYVIAFAGARGVYSDYSSGDIQATLTGSVGIFGQFGHFSRNFLDYTSFNLSYSETLESGESPFIFDRSADDRVLSFGMVQQLYGPLRIGFQSSVNLNGDAIDTSYILEYSRRTYAITLQYNPVREIGSLGLRISDFNWNSTPEPFSGAGGTVSGGVVRSPE